MPADNFTFTISLSVLDHLGRNLYRSFATVLGEAISNAWDAEADNVCIYIDKDKNSFCIKDDGVGMDTADFQNKFLKIGYTKRKNGTTHSPNKRRPYIGRKGIGKLALLSYAEKITVASKVEGGSYVGGVIVNSALSKAITEDLIPQDYPLGALDLSVFGKHTENHKHGTIIYFEGIKDGIKNSEKFLRKIIALYFRFSLVDKSFTIFLDDTPVNLDDLNDLAQNTEFLWVINDLEDPYVTEKLSNTRNLGRAHIFTSNKDATTLKNELLAHNITISSAEIDKIVRMENRTRTDVVCDKKQFFVEARADKLEVYEKTVKMAGNVRGFIASVKLPSHLKIPETEERIGVDLFVNGRLRERNILTHIPTAQIPESYFYGQIHFNELDDEQDRFATSREGIIADDPKYRGFLTNLRARILEINSEWDKNRSSEGEDGDPENKKISKKERKSRELYRAVSDEYTDGSDKNDSGNKKKIDEWVSDLKDDAVYNFTSYAECFISENLIRKHIQEKKIAMSSEATSDVARWRKKEQENMAKGNVSIPIRKDPNDVSFLDMDGLTHLVDNNKGDTKVASLTRDGNEYKPIRDAVMHTALLTDLAKGRLTTVYENIQGRIQKLLSEKSSSAPTKPTK